MGVTAPKKEPSPRASSVRPHFKLTSIQLAQAVADGHPGALEEQQFRASLQPAKTAARQAKQSLMTATGAELRALVAQGNMEAQAEIHRRAANRAAKGKKPVGVR